MPSLRFHCQAGRPVPKPTKRDLQGAADRRRAHGWALFFMPRSTARPEQATVVAGSGEVTQSRLLLTDQPSRRGHYDLRHDPVALHLRRPVPAKEARFDVAADRGRGRR